MDVIYLVPHTHYDVAWVFPKEDYLWINEMIYQKAVDLMKTTDYKFIIEQVYLLEAIEERNPDLWEDMRRLIRAGKLEVVDGQYVMPDLMVPTGEVIIREIQFGKEYCRKKLGVEVPVAWASDGFGLNAQMPQIYRQTGYRWVAFRRGTDKPESEFLWKGLDGSTIVAHWMPLGYRAGLDLEHLKESYEKLKEHAVSRHILMPSGSGVTMPNEETPKFVRSWNEGSHGVELRIATPREFFEALNEVAERLSTVEGEMYSGRFSEVFPDICSSRIWIIQEARRAENLLLNAERFATLSWMLGNRYPGNQLKAAWKKLLFAANHDVLPGTGIDEIYAETRDHFSYLRNREHRLLSQSMRDIVAKIDTGGEAVVVFNPLGWDVRNWVELKVELPPGKIQRLGLADGDEEIPIEVTRLQTHEDGTVREAQVGFIASVPSLGYATYRIVERTQEFPDAVPVTEGWAENPYFHLNVGGDTGMIDLRLKGDDLHIVGNELVLEDEVGDLYYHHGRLTQPIKAEGGEGFRYGDFKAKNFRIFPSPVRTRFIFENEFYALRWPYRLLEKYKPMLYKHNTFQTLKEIIVYRDLPRVDFVTTIDNQYPYIRLRVRFTPNIRSPYYHRETQFGVTRETVFDKVGVPARAVETYSRAPALNWIDYGDGTKGMALINEGNPENEVRTGVTEMTLLRSVSCLSADGESGPMIPTPDALELKRYTFRYSLYPHQGDWRAAKAYQQGYEFNQGLLAVQISGKGKLPPSQSFMTLHPNNLILSAFKRDGNRRGVILRFFETTGRHTEAKITCFQEIRRAARTNLLEKQMEPVPVSGNRLAFAVKPFEIVSLRLEF